MSPDETHSGPKLDILPVARQAEFGSDEEYLFDNLIAIRPPYAGATLTHRETFDPSEWWRNGQQTRFNVLYACPTLGQRTCIPGQGYGKQSA